MPLFKKPLPYPKEVLQFLHEHMGGAPEPERRKMLHSVLEMNDMYIDTIGLKSEERGFDGKPMLYLTTSAEPPFGNLKTLESPYAWMPLIWVVLRIELLPRAYEMFGPDMEVLIEGDEISYLNTIGGLLEIIDNDYFEYWKR